MTHELSRQVEAELGPLFAAPEPLKSDEGQMDGFRHESRRPPSPVARRRWRWESAGAYTATALLGIVLGSVLTVARAPTVAAPQPQQAEVGQDASSKARLQMMVATAPLATIAPPQSALPATEPSAPTDGQSPAPPAAAGARAPPRPASPGLAQASAPRGRGPASALQASARPARAEVDGASACAPGFGGCFDGELADADQRLTEAYYQAWRAGVPARRLSANQIAWELERDRAAARSESALLDAYRAKIEQVEGLAAASDGREDDAGPRLGWAPTALDRR